MGWLQRTVCGSGLTLFLAGAPARAQELERPYIDISTVTKGHGGVRQVPDESLERVLRKLAAEPVGMVYELTHPNENGGKEYYIHDQDGFVRISCDPAGNHLVYELGAGVPGVKGFKPFGIQGLTTHGYLHNSKKHTFMVRVYNPEEGGVPREIYGTAGDLKDTVVPEGTVELSDGSEPRYIFPLFSLDEAQRTRALSLMLKAFNLCGSSNSLAYAMESLSQSTPKPQVPGYETIDARQKMDEEVSYQLVNGQGCRLDLFVGLEGAFEVSWGPNPLQAAWLKDKRDPSCGNDFELASVTIRVDGKVETFFRTKSRQVAEQSWSADEYAQIPEEMKKILDHLLKLSARLGIQAEGFAPLQDHLMSPAVDNNQLETVFGNRAPSL